jgi:rhamnosyltransferase
MNQPGDIEVSFVIRTYNEALFIGRLLETLAAQEGVAGSREVIIVDSGSTDDTVLIAQRWPVKLLTMAKEKFDYAEALNLGIANSRGRLVVNISAHAIPSGPNWLAALHRHFTDERVAGVYCRQLPWPEADRREVARIRREFGEEPAIYDRMPAANRVPFTNSAGCLRRRLWEQHPFRLPWGEDFEWATWAVAGGHKIVYEPGVWVYHSHNLTCRQAAWRLIQGEKAVDLERHRARSAALTLRQAAGFAYRDLKELLRADGAVTSRLKPASEAVFRAYWFLRDFKS